MTTKLPSSRIVYAVSTILRQHHARHQLILIAPGISRRQYAQKSKGPTVRNPIENALPAYSVRSALELVSNKHPSDPVNPPRSTLPPPLDLPTRGPENVAVYLYRMGRAYAGFYKDGIKSVWFNYQAARRLHERITREGGAKDVVDAVTKKVITRSDFQLLARNSHDIGKLPIFGLLVMLFGEWLPLVVPFIPSAVPGTSRIPKQVRDMRLKAEERRRVSFRRGITEPGASQIPELDQHSSEKGKPTQEEWPLAFNTGFRGSLIKQLRGDQLFHISSTLGLHSTLWDRVQLAPPELLLRARISKRFQHLSLDDILLTRCGGAARLSPAELHNACEDRGLDVLGKQDEVLRESLTWWLKRQEDDRGRGRALLLMLFRRLAIREWVELNVQANTRSQA